LTAVFFVIIAFLPNNILRVILGLPLVLFFPGYLLMSAFFHKNSSLDGIQKTAFSFVVSIAVVPIMLFILNYSPWGITLYSGLIAITIFIFVASVIAWFRQRKLPEEQKHNTIIDLTLCGKKTSLSKIISLVLAMVIIVTVGILIYTIANPRTNEKYTEFYIVGSDGNTNGYPTNLKFGDTGKVVLGIINREQSLTQYQIEININGTSNGTFGPITLKPDQKSENEVSFIPEMAGDNQEVNFILYKDGQNEPYLSLHLWIDVS